MRFLHVSLRVVVRIKQRMWFGGDIGRVYNVLYRRETRYFSMRM